MAEPLQLKRTTKGTLVDGEPFVDKVNKKLLVQAGSEELQFTPLRNTIYVFKHVPITGILSAPNVINITPNGSLDIVDAGVSVSEGWTGNSRTIESFGADAHYLQIGFAIEIIPEQEEQIINMYDSLYPKVQSGKLVFRVARSQAGLGYDEGSTNPTCFCTIIIKKLF